MPNPDLLSPGYALFVVSNPDLEVSARWSFHCARRIRCCACLLAGCRGMVVSDEDSCSDDERVGQVPTLGEDTNVEFMVMGKNC